MELLSLSAVELSKAIKEGKTTAPQVMEAVLAQIDKTEDCYHCYVTIDRTGAMERAAQVQRCIEAGELTGPLAGFLWQSRTIYVRRGCAPPAPLKYWRILYLPIPPRRCEIWRLPGQCSSGRLIWTSLPWALPRKPPTMVPPAIPGPQNMCQGVLRRQCGSSGGGRMLFALGSDTGGSIRQPAGYCGVVGLKPTYGTVSRFGLVAYGSSLDQIGPLTGNVTDCAAVLEVIASHDPKDSTSVERQDRDFLSALTADVTGMRIGIPRDYLGEGLDREVKAAVLQAAEVLKSRGAIVEEFDLGLVEYAIPTYYTIAAAEASSNLERFDGIKYGYRAPEDLGLHAMYKKTRSQGFGPEVKRRIMLGSFVLSSGYYDAYYLKALRVKAMIKKPLMRHLPPMI